MSTKALTEESKAATAGDEAGEDLQSKDGEIAESQLVLVWQQSSLQICQLNSGFDLNAERAKEAPIIQTINFAKSKVIHCQFEHGSSEQFWVLSSLRKGANNDD